MHSVAGMVGLVLLVPFVVVLACLMVALLDIAMHRHGKQLPSPAEMRRHMLCGFYCNPEDPRPLVHRPFGRGYTLNLRREHLVVTLIVISVVALLAAMVFLIPASS